MSSSLFFTEIPVQIGSNKMLININEFKRRILCDEFLEIVLKKCKLNKTIANTYCVFENVNGVERLVNSDENIIELWAIWKSSKSCIKFFIRKCRVNDIKSIKVSQFQQQMITKYYNKSKIVQNDEKNDNEAQLSKKRKLCSSHVDVKVTMSHEIVMNATELKSEKHNSSHNIFHLLYTKLKQQKLQYNSYKILKEDRKCSDDSDESVSVNNDNDDNIDCSRLNLKSFF